MGRYVGEGSKLLRLFHFFYNPLPNHMHKGMISQYKQSYSSIWNSLLICIEIRHFYGKRGWRTLSSFEGLKEQLHLSDKGDFWKILQLRSAVGVFLVWQEKVEKKMWYKGSFFLQMYCTLLLYEIVRLPNQTVWKLKLQRISTRILLRMYGNILSPMWEGQQGMLEINLYSTLQNCT